MTDTPIGTYVLATKYADGDPGDPWALGFCHGMTPDGERHIIVDSEGNAIRSGFKHMRGPLHQDVGRWLWENRAALEKSPPGTVSLWGLLTDAAFGPDA